MSLQALKLLGLIRARTFPFSTVDSFMTSYFTLVRSRVEYASITWNALTSTDASKLERIQQKFLALCRNRFFPQIHYSYVTFSDYLNFHSLCCRRCQLDVLFLVSIYSGFKFCPSLLETVGICIPI
jgi:hypothetical protein